MDTEFGMFGFVVIMALLQYLDRKSLYLRKNILGGEYMEQLCENCIHYRAKINLYRKDCIACELTNAVIVNETAQSCRLYNKDISSEPICFNCKHFAGGSDWGLACAKHYHRLPKALTEMCEDGERGMLND